MKTLLSIDVDFWNGQDVKRLKRYLNRVTKLAKRQCIPISAITNHQQILKVANVSKARRIVNVDTHSDLAEGDNSELNCGTWVNYVKWRGSGEYVWYHKSAAWQGDCSYNRDMFTKYGLVSRKRPRLKRYGVDWKKVRHARKGPPNPEKYDLTEVVICLSPSYSDSNLQDFFHEWRKRNAIPYKRGRLREDFGRKCYPPKIRFN